MTKEEIKNIVRHVFRFYDANADNYSWTDMNEACGEIIKALEQEPSEDVMAIHTQGLDEGIRCAMCTNSMKSDRGCDGGCVVNEAMYKEVMNTIRNHIVPPVTPTRKKGKWIEERDDYGNITGWHCSNCYDKTGFVTTCAWDYCPNCGAEMESEE